MAGPRNEDLTESELRADPGRQERFDALYESGYFSPVVEANRAYLEIAVPNAKETERTHWALTCLPTTNGGGRLSVVTMKGMEVFVLHLPDGTRDGRVTGFVNVRRSVLGVTDEACARIAGTFDLTIRERDYRDTHGDGCSLVGDYRDLMLAFTQPRIATAARDLAESLLASRTSYSRYHNYQLADHVLGRA